jgi:phenylalanyl-tRNA synthetase beta chain
VFISLDWISDFVDLSDLAPEVIADRLTMATAEVEGVTTLNRLTADKTVGRIVSVETLPEKEGKKLFFCKVDIGTGTPVQTVCGAPNVAVGLKAAFAPIGAKARAKTGGAESADIEVEVTASELAGHRSEGILCSAFEMGMSNWHEILFEFPAETPVGTKVSDLIPERDILIEIDNKSLTHRPDLWGHYGFAREFSAIFRRPLAPLPCYDLSPFEHLPAYPIEIVDDHCPCYGAIVVGVKAGSVNIPAPVKMQRRLHALERRTYNLLVDLTNYVSLEIGQPTHAFDADTIRGIRVAPMGKEGKFVTLDGQERKMIPEDMMICDGEKPIAIAGIMGGLETEVTPKTTRIVLESANFKSARIRKTAGRLDLRTDASQRYEKSQPPANVKKAAERILYLIAESAIPFEVESRFSLRGDLDDEIREILLPPGQLNALAGIEFPDETVLEILRSIRFEAELLDDGTLRVGVPPFRSRKDISIPADIVEEVMRLYGFDNVPPVLPQMSLAPLHVEEKIKLSHRVQRFLSASAGFLEVHNYAWFDDNFLAKIGYDPGQTLVLKNPPTPFNSRLRTTLMPNLLALVPKNRPFKDDFRVFEMGKVYLPKGAWDDPTPVKDSAEKCLELGTFAGISYMAAGKTPEEHYLEIRGVLNDLRRIFAFDEFSTVANVTGVGSPTPWQTEGLWIEIRQDDKKVGAMGLADRTLMENLLSEKDKGHLVWFEYTVQKLSGLLFPRLTFREPPKFPRSWQDFSIVWDTDQGYQKLASKLDEFTHPLLKDRSFLTVYKGKGLEKGMGSYSFRFAIGADDHTLTGDELEGFHREFLDFLKANQMSLRG